MAPRFSVLQDALAARRIELRDDIEGVEVEQVVVLETAGPVDKFYRAVRRAPGLEWLSEWEEEADSDEDFFHEGDAGRPLTGRAYLVMQNQQGLQELLRLWGRYQEGPDAAFDWGLSRFRDVFSQLRDLRLWGPEDRLFETGLLEDWAQRLEEEAEEVQAELDLWFRRDGQKRDEAEAVVRRGVEELGGQVTAQCVVPEIAYHGLMARLPIDEVPRIMAMGQSRLVRCDQVMFMRPTGQATVRMPPEIELAPTVADDQPGPEGTPVAAILDGLPEANHPRLANRVVVDDPEDWARGYEAGERVHGTMCASIVTRGCLDGDGVPLNRPVYVRPVLRPNPRDFHRPRQEAIPDDELPIDLIHRAVRRLYENGDAEGVAPTVRIINLAVCDRSRPFYRRASPLAKLLDYLSHRYDVLFIVSAGNHVERMELGLDRNEIPALEADEDALESLVLRTVRDRAWDQRVLAPAESINALTVGACHRDEAVLGTPPHLVDPLKSTARLSSPISAMGGGIRRSLKPDVLFPGGRQLYRWTPDLGDPADLAVVESLREPGVRAASTSDAGEGEAYFSGTSVAAALATRTGVRLYEVLEQLREEPNGDSLTDEHVTVTLKALLAHGASWGEASDSVARTFGELDVESRRKLAGRMLGYGLVDPHRCVSSSDERATIIGTGSLADDSADRFQVPLPPGLAGQAVWRRVTLTLAWISPVRPSHQAYRRAALWFSPYGDERGADGDLQDSLSLTRTQGQWQAVRRGTLQHEIFEGEDAALFADGDDFAFQVNCRADAGELDEEIPYAIAATVEVAPGIAIPIYDEIRARIRARVGIPVGG